jgi:RNA polymerase sigma-70 factor, ECF subfamily
MIKYKVTGNSRLKINRRILKGVSDNFMYLPENDLKKAKNEKTPDIEELYNSYKERIYAYLKVITKGNQEMVEDIFSETFLAAFKSVSKLKSNDYALPWLLRIAKNKFIDQLRKKYREKKYYDEIKYKISSDNNENEFFENERSFLVNLAMDKIKNKYNDILRMKYIDGKSQEEIAAVLGKKSKAVESLLTRARVSFKKEIDRLNREYL